jgi:hypothetical protein
MYVTMLLEENKAASAIIQLQSLIKAVKEGPAFDSVQSFKSHMNIWKTLATPQSLFTIRLLI